MTIFYCGQRISACGNQPVWKIDENGHVIERLSPKRSQDVSLHSPDGFQWGYAGAGPTQLALAILLDVTKDPEEAQGFCTWFKEDYVANFKDTWTLSDQEIKDWLVRQKGGVVVSNPN